MPKAVVWVLIMACVLAASPALGAAAAPPTSEEQRHAAGPSAVDGSASQRAKVRIQMKVVPAHASPGQQVKVKGRVVGRRGSSKVKIHLLGAQTISKRTKANGKFKVTVTLPADQKIKACVGAKCKVKHVPGNPDSINYSWRNSDGYTFTAVVTGMATTNISVDTLNASPGEANISLTFAGDGAITNTTPGRDAVPDRTFLIPVFPASSTLCQATGTTGSHFWETTAVQQEANPPTSFHPIPYCNLRAFALDGTDIPTLGPGQTGHKDFAQTPGFQTVRVTFPVPEAQAQAIANDLTSPAFWGLGRGIDAIETVAGTCTAVMNLGATSRGGLTVCTQGGQ
jgi:hypothetical protein